jgi:BirA family biotin operon repressor/biotin-[acetyl-CoA-carboxylase] ligase
MAASFDARRLEPEILGTRFEGKVHHFESVGSTMDLALAAAAGGAQCGVWVADEQTHGRGRGDHEWLSIVGDGLYVSLLVTPHLPLSQARLIPLLTGLAVRTGVMEATGLELDLRWPNDLMFGELKCGGILVESAGRSGDQLRYAVIGIGLNVNHAAFPPALAKVATSLLLESGREFDREEILGPILRQMDHELRILRREFEGAHKFSRPQDHILREVEKASTWIRGKHVRVGADEAGSGGYTGWTRGLDQDGFLLVEDEDGVMRTVLSGGVRSF